MKGPSPNFARGPLAGNMQQTAVPAAPAYPPVQTQPVYAEPDPNYEPPPQRSFVAPKSQAVRQEQQLRANRLKALMRPGVLQLRDVDITLYDAPPLTPYEVKSRFGSSNSRMKATQTGEGFPTQSTQTEPIEMATTPMQWPEDGPAAGNSAAGLVASSSAHTAGLLTANIGR